MNTYKIMNTNDKQFPYAIVSGETVISCHATQKEAAQVQRGYYVGDKAQQTK